VERSGVLKRVRVRTLTQGGISLTSSFGPRPKSLWMNHPIPLREGIALLVEVV
jgi:hypothetical protein